MIDGGDQYEEIAEIMNCPIGSVRSRIFRAREAIAQRLRPLLDTRPVSRAEWDAASGDPLLVERRL